MLTFTVAYSIYHEITRGSILLTDEIITGGTVPICLITIPFVVPALLLRGEMIFPASVQALIGIVLFWLGFALLFGRGGAAGYVSSAGLIRHVQLWLRDRGSKWRTRAGDGDSFLMPFCSS